MKVQQHEIDAQIQSAMQSNARTGEARTAVVFQMWVSARRFTLGWNFQPSVKVGENFLSSCGDRCVVLALV